MQLFKSHDRLFIDNRYDAKPIICCDSLASSISHAMTLMWLITEPA